MKVSESWPTVALGDVVLETQYGTAAKSNEHRRGRPVLRMNNVTYDGHVDLRELKWVELTPAEAEKLSLRDGDLLFNRTNSRELVGKTAVWSGPDGNFPPETGGECELSTSWDTNPGVDLTPQFRVGGEMRFRIRVSVSGGGEGYARIRILYDPVVVTGMPDCP